MKADNRQHLLIVLFAVAVGLWLGDLIIFEPLAKMWTANSKQIAGLKQQVREGSTMISNAPAIRGQWTKMTSAALTNNTSVAESQVISALNNWSRSSGAQITSIMPQWKYDSTNYWTLNCRVEASGTLQNLGLLIYNIERGQAIKLDSVEMAAHEVTGQQLTLGLQISTLALLPSRTTTTTTQVRR